jgi:tellurite resistance protein
MDALRRDGQEACFARVAEVLGGNDARYEAFQVAAGVALVDGDLTDHESEALDRLAQTSGLSFQEADQLFESVEAWMD